MLLAFKRFIKYSAVGLSTSLLDLLLLYILADFLLINIVLASGSAFLVAVNINYVISRKYVFKGTMRGVKDGYVNFILIVLVGLGAVMGGMYIFVNVLNFGYLVSRVSIAMMTGLWNYLMNLYVNFKVAGKH